MGYFFFFQAEDGIRDYKVTGVQTCALPIFSGATVRVGTVDGTTDATGLFVANGVTGPQTVVASSPSYRSEVWIGANGANVTIDLQPATASTVPHANLSGTITGFSALPALPANHLRIAVVQYSQSDAGPD